MDPSVTAAHLSILLIRFQLARWEGLGDAKNTQLCPLHFSFRIGNILFEFMAGSVHTVYIYIGHTGFCPSKDCLLDRAPSLCRLRKTFANSVSDVVSLSFCHHCLLVANLQPVIHTCKTWNPFLIHWEAVHFILWAWLHGCGFTWLRHFLVLVGIAGSYLGPCPIVPQRDKLLRTADWVYNVS